MRDPYIEQIRKILEYRGRQDLAELLKNSTSEIRGTGTFGCYLYSELSIFEIHSPLEDYEKLKGLSKEDREEILKAVREIFPPKEYSPEIIDIEFQVKMNTAPEEAGLLAYCTECGAPQGLFTDIGELRRKIAEQGKCKSCGAEFRFLSNGKIWNLEYEILPSKEEYVIKLLEEIAKESQQYIFCYEDLGPQATQYRYPQKRIKFHMYDKTERASPAFAMNIYDKEIQKLEKSYCFDSPYALLQLAREALKGYYWLKYGIRK